MGTLQARVEVLGRAIALLAAYAIVVGAVSVAINIPGAIDGEIPSICRVILGVWGVFAGVLLWSGRSFGISGWQAVMTWSVIQIFYVAWNSDGSPTTQLLSFPLTFTSETTIDGVVTSFREYGINFVGVALTIWAGAVRGRWEHHVAPLANPLPTLILYDVEFRTEGEAARNLGSARDPDSARRAAISQASRLQKSGHSGEIVVIAMPAGTVVAREPVG